MSLMVSACFRRQRCRCFLDPLLFSFLVFLVVGFFAQLVDGAVGMAYGVTSASVLLAFGVPPANVSASVHASKVFTCAASGAAHVRLGNVDFKLMAQLAVAGAAASLLGAYVVTSVDAATIKPFIVGYLALMGLIIIVRAWRAPEDRPGKRFRYALPLGATGGFLDAVGGGGWGPTVTTTLIGSGVEPRKAIGSTNAAEFFVAVSVSTAFIGMLATGHWEDAPGLRDSLWPVAGLIVGGLIAAPFAARITRSLPPNRMSWVVGLIVLGLAGWQGAQLLGLV